MIRFTDIINRSFTFKLFASTIKVVWDNKGMNDRERYGESCFSNQTITMSHTHGLDPLSKDKVLDTFYHERVHMILDHMKEHDLSRNEKFVDTFAKLLRQSDETIQFDIPYAEAQ